MAADPHPDSALRCDLFCAVVDNLGDAGVCWRLARQLAQEHGWQVRLWIDEPAPLALLRPGLVPGLPVQQMDGVEVCRWCEPFEATAPADVVIEAFACTLPADYVAAMARSPRRPVWVNLEYLSAEDWVAECHGQASPHPSLPLVKHFLFPGFFPGTGGLIREQDLAARRQRFDLATFRNEIGLPPAGNELTISMFSYGHAPLPALMEAWAEGQQPVRLLRPGMPGPKEVRGALTVQPLPFLSQLRYDELLWACDLNFVRGEDSFVRAQWAERPFVWHIYPQTENAHRLKLEAFLGRYCALLPDSSALALRRFWRAWNGDGEIAAAWPGLQETLPLLAAQGRDWARSLLVQGNLAKNLVHFCAEQLK